MIRRRLHHHWARTRHHDDPVRLLLASFWTVDRWKWLDRYFDWSVARFGEARGANPWWDRLVLGRAAAWLDDWRQTLAVRLGPVHEWQLAVLDRLAAAERDQ